MRAFEFLYEGGWDTTATQSTVITPSVVKTALATTEKLVQGFNEFLKSKGIPAIRIGSPTGSSAYHDVDPEDKIYGDIDLQIVVPEVEELADKTTSQIQSYWYGLLDEYIKSTNPKYIHPDSTSGHPIVSVGGNGWVQVDLMPHPEPLEKWGRYRVTPERGVKGLLMGNMFSVLGALLDMSIQHSGVQLKVKDNVRQSFAKRKDVKVVTVTTDIENFVQDIFNYEAQSQGIQNPKADSLLLQNPGVKIKEIKISDLVNSVKGLAKSFEDNGMLGKDNLSKYTDAESFINEFKRLYSYKAEKDIGSAKRDKAETPEAKARADADREKISQGLETVLGMF